MSDSDGEDGASYNDDPVRRVDFPEPVTVGPGEVLLIGEKDGKVLARAVPEGFRLGGPNPSPCSIEGCGKPATVYDRDRHPFIWCDDHDPTDYIDDVDPEVEARLDAKLDTLAALLSPVATAPASDVVDALDPSIDPEAEGFHEEPKGPEPAWAPAFRRAGGRFHGARYQFVSCPPDNDDLRAAIRSGIVFPAVDAETEDGDDDTAGWVYRVRSTCPDGGACHHKCEAGACFRVRHCSPLSGVYPDDRWPACFTGGPVNTALSEKAAKAAQVTAADIAAGIETVAGFKAKLLAARAAKRAKAREDDGITQSHHPGRFTFSDSIEADDGLVLDVDVECFIEASPYGATFEEPAGCDLEACDFVAHLDGVKLSPGIVEDMAQVRGWSTRAVESFDSTCGDRVQPGIYQDTRLGGSRWQVLGHLREPGQADGGWVVCRPVSAYGLPLSGVAHGPRGGWRLAESTVWDDETMAREVPKAGPGVLREAGTVDAPDPLTQAGPWARINALLSRASATRSILDDDPEGADRIEVLREARDLAYEQAARENALQDVEAGRPVLMSYQVRNLIEACGDDTGLRVAIAALGPGVKGEPTEAGYLVRLTDAETHEIHRLLDRVETRTGQPTGGIRWVENLRGKLSRRAP